jgi:hypothetical protein
MYNKRIGEIQKMLDQHDDRWYKLYQEKNTKELETIESRLYKELEWARRGEKETLVEEIKEDLRCLHAVLELQMIVKQQREMEESDEIDNNKGGYSLL